MKNFRKYSALLILPAILLSGCGKETGPNNINGETKTGTQVEESKGTEKKETYTADVKGAKKLFKDKIKKVKLDDLSEFKPKLVDESTGLYEAKLKGGTLKFRQPEDETEVFFPRIVNKDGNETWLWDREDEPKRFASVKLYVKEKGAENLSLNDFKHMKYTKTVEDGVVNCEYKLDDGILKLTFRENEDGPFAVTLIPDSAKKQ